MIWQKIYLKFKVLNIFNWNNSLFLSHLDKKFLQTVINHPVHIRDRDGSLAPSAFIPFCSFGNDMEAMGIKIEGFDIPVCNSFKKKVFIDALCYEIELEKFKNGSNIKEQLQAGLVLVLDFNEDHQLHYDYTKNESKELKFVEKDDTESARIYLDTLSIIIFFRLI